MNPITGVYFKHITPLLALNADLAKKNPISHATILESRQSMLETLRHKKLGFGSLHLKEMPLRDVSRMFDAFLEEGCLYFEAARGYDNEDVFRKCLTSRHGRESYLLADKLPVRGEGRYDRQRFMDVFNDSLNNCGVDYFDFYLLHNLVCGEYKQLAAGFDLFDFLTELKAKGLVKYIGFSFHDTADDLDELLSKHHDKLDFVQLQINYLDWDNPVIQSKECYEVAVKYGLPVFVMVPAKGGALLELPGSAVDLLNRTGNVSAAEIAYRFAASLDNVALVLSGMTTTEQVRENAAIFREPCVLSHSEQETIEKVREILKSSAKIQCTRCGYCLSACNKNIPIPELIGLFNYAVTRGYYWRVCNGKGKASDCVKCGKCESACPQKIGIRAAMDEVYSMYEKEYPATPSIKGKIARILQRLGVYAPVYKLYRMIRKR